MFRISLLFTAPIFMINMVFSHVEFLGWMYTGSIMVGWCNLEPIKPELEAPGFSS
jgi:hypothetical protein